MEKQFIAVIIIFILIAVTVVIFLVKALLKNMEKYRAALETVNNLEQLNARMRSQRHDYINQMQVIYGLLELEEYDEALDYLKPIFTDMMKVGTALKTKIPAVNALLMAKMQTAEKQNIDMYVEVKSNLENIGVEGWELDLIDGVPEELWMEVCDIVQEAVIKTIPKKKKCKKAKWLSEKALQRAKKRREVKGKGEKERYTHLNAEFQRIARRDKKAFLSDQCKEIEENNRMGKTRDLFKKIRDTKGTFHAKMGSIKDRNGMDLTEAEDIKKRWQEYTEELYKKDLHDPDNHDGVITHLEPDILE